MTPEDRWILSRLERAIAEIDSDLDRYDFAHAALELYGFFWSELCDWYLEIVKPRLYDGDPGRGLACCGSADLGSLAGLSPA